METNTKTTKTCNCTTADFEWTLLEATINGEYTLVEATICPACNQTIWQDTNPINW